ncbi:unnamed protein product [Symbiodinium sp. CCMP2592]|nr:unnamed protein product [Symbiodinium sp. CCMP2592]
MGDPSFSTLCPGATIDIVVLVRQVGPEGSCLLAPWNEETCRCSTRLEPCQVYTLYGVAFQGFFEGVPFLQMQDDSLVIKRPQRDEHTFGRIVDVCAGIGGITQGFAATGGQGILALDRLAIACQTLRMNGHNVIEGDIENRSVRIELHQQCAGVSCILCAGMPCLGIRVQGLGLVPPKTGSLLRAILTAAWHLQTYGLVLESSQMLDLHPGLLGILQSFADKAGFQLVHTRLELAHQWASRRHRWWAVLLPKTLPVFRLHTWPAAMPPVLVGDVLPELPGWSQQVESQLIWDDAEQCAFSDLLSDRESRLVNLNAQAPPATQCIGCPLRPCPCGRRPAQPSMSMNVKGLACLGVPARTGEGPRHPHPCELGLLISLPTSVLHLPCLRAALCLVGQSSAPLQALWIGANVKYWAQCQAGTPPESPLDILAAFKANLCEQGSKLVASTAAAMGSICVQDGTKLRLFQFPGSVTASELLAAERVHVGPGFSLSLWQADRPVPGQEILSEQPAGPTYTLRVKRKRAARSPPPHSEPAGGLDIAPGVGCSDLLIWSGLSELATTAGSTHIVPPKALDTLLTMLRDGFAFSPGAFSFPEPCLLLLPFVQEAHWTLIAFRVQLGLAAATVYDGIPGRNTASARQLTDALSLLGNLKLESFVEAHHWTQKETHSCGVLLLAHAAAHITGRAESSQLDRARAFVSSFPPHSSELQGCGGLSADQEAAIGQVLISKGVPQEQVAERIQGAVKKVGPGPLAQALQQKNVWQALKAVASRPSTQYKWVQPEELRQHIEAKAHSKHGTEIGNAKAKKQRRSGPKVESLDTHVCRLNLFKDESRFKWEELAEAPIRSLLANVKELRVCKDPACNHSCQCFHPAVEETVDNLFLDIWARSFCKLNGARTAPVTAELFQAYVRVPASAITHLLRLAVPGLYFEPRAADGTGPHPSWAVVWLPGASAQQAQHSLRTTEKAIALARLGTRYGLRTKDADEQIVFESLRPQHQFVKVRISAKYRLHPLPFGFQRASLVQLLHKWGWCARPLQPDRGDSVGAAWLVGAAGDPPSQALPLGSDFVLVTKQKDTSSARRGPPALCASAKTRRRILLDDDPDEPAETPIDPWSEGPDPWAKARSSQQLRPEPAASSQVVSKLQTLREDLTQDLQEEVRKQVQAFTPPPGLTAQDQRINELEVGINELRHQNTKFESWFQSFGTKVTDQASQIGQLTATVQEQQGELVKVRSELQTTVKTEVSSLQSALTNQMSAQLAGQLEQIQALLADKKPRIN